MASESLNIRPGYSGTEVVGEIANDTDFLIGFVKVTITMKNSAGKVLDTDYTFVRGKTVGNFPSAVHCDMRAARDRPGRPAILGNDSVWNEAQERHRLLDLDAHAIADELNDLADTLADARPDAILDLLSEVRDFGPTAGSAWDTGQIAATLAKGESTVRPFFESITKYIPTDWLARSAERGPLKFRKVGRGFYRDHDATITISGSGRGARSTALHEFGHRAP